MNIWIPNTEKDPLVDDYSNVENVLHPDGLIFVDGKEVAPTKQCPHCGGHYTPRKGEMRLRCVKHNKKVCDNHVCNTYCIDYYETVGQLSTREF